MNIEVTIKTEDLPEDASTTRPDALMQWIEQALVEKAGEFNSWAIANKVPKITSLQIEGMKQVKL